MPPLSRLRERAAALPLDRAPLRRAGALAALLVALLVAGRALGPSRPASGGAVGERQSLRAGAEEVSAERGLWTAGRATALLLLAAGGAFAVYLHRRAAPAAAPTASLEVLETHALGPGQSLRLVACGDEVLLLGVGAEGAQMLRHWPRERFEAGAPLAAPTVRFADALASELADAPEAGPAELVEPEKLSGEQPPPLGEVAAKRPEGVLGASDPSGHPHPAPRGAPSGGRVDRLTLPQTVFEDAPPPPSLVEGTAPAVEPPAPVEPLVPAERLAPGAPAAPPPPALRQFAVGHA